MLQRFSYISFLFKPPCYFVDVSSCENMKHMYVFSDFSTSKKNEIIESLQLFKIETKVFLFLISSFK